MSSSPDQTALMQEILNSIKNLQLNQVQLASNVDAITGRVNVLAGMKEVRDVASTDLTTVSKPSESLASSDESPSKDDDVPQSPTISAAKPDETPIPSYTQKASTGTSRIILT
ncbi:hypothetical protein EYC84_003462 [Monilinia fructicola]|nr:hypothetical protein EYC84_003462 [Monilinia fructicola]